MENILKTRKSPADFGFDENKFIEYRTDQLEIAHKAAASAKPLYLIEAPTGLGKSLLALTVHKIMESPRAVYLVSTKQLQDQIENDFHIPVVKGRSNFPCLHFNNLFPEVSADICHEFKGEKDCEFSGNCPYLMQKRAALAAPICVLNYPMFFTEANFVGSFSGVNLLILDEIDTLEDHLMKFVEVAIPRGLSTEWDLGVPEYKTKVESWKEWASEAEETARKQVAKLPISGNLPPKFLKSIMRKRRLHKKLAYLKDALDAGWVMETSKNTDGVNSLTFKPVKVGAFAKNALWRHTTKSLGMSATIMGAEAMAIELGLHTWDVDFISMPSPFPIETRLVKYIPVADVTFKNKVKAYPALAKAVSAILKEHPKEKILIHVVSYELRNYVIQNVTFNIHKLFAHDRLDRATVLEDFKIFGGPAVLISPSMERGVDLPGDLCRIVVVTKVPYPDKSSPQINQRLYGFSDGSRWYARRAARALVQMTGRATRYVGDYSISYILDQQFGHMVGRTGDIFPRWWRESVKSSTLPGITSLSDEDP